MPNRYLIWGLPIWASLGALWYARETTLICARDTAALADAAIKRGQVAALTGNQTPDVMDAYGRTNIWAEPLMRDIETTAALAARVATMTNPVWIASNDVSALDADQVTLIDAGRYVPTATNWVTADGIAHADYLPIGRVAGDNGIANLLYEPKVRTAADRYPVSGSPTNYYAFALQDIGCTELAEAMTNWWMPLSAWFRPGAWQTITRIPWAGGSYWTTNMGPLAYCTPAEYVVSNSLVRRDIVPSKRNLNAIRAALRGVKYTLYKVNSLSGTYVYQDGYQYGNDASPSSDSLSECARWCIGADATWYTTTNADQTISWLSSTAQDYHVYLTNGQPSHVDGSSETMRLCHITASLPYPCAWAIKTGIVEQVTLYVVPRYTILDGPPWIQVDTNRYTHSWSHTQPKMIDWSAYVAGLMSPPGINESGVNATGSSTREVTLSYKSDPTFFGRVAYRLWTSAANPTNLVADFDLSLGALPVMPASANATDTVESRTSDDTTVTLTASITARVEPDCWLILVKWADVLN